MNRDRSLLTIDDAARYLNVSKASLRRWTKSGRLSCVRVGLRAERRFAVADLERFLQPDPNNIKPAVVERPLLPAIAALDERKTCGAVRHVCSHFADSAECWRLFLPYFCAHVQAEAPIFYIADSTSREQLFAAVTAAGFEPQQLSERGLLEFVHSSAAYLRSGSFSASAMIDYVGAVIERARLAGHRRALVSGEMTWSLSGAAGVEGMIDYENQLNGLLRQSPGVTIVCHYSIARFDARLTLETIAVHPFVQVATGVFRGFQGGTQHDTNNRIDAAP